MEEIPSIKQFLQYQSEFMGYLMAMTRNLESAEEIFQNSAVAVMQTPKPEEIRDFRAWAKELVRRQALHYLREQGTASARVRAVEPRLLEEITHAFVDDVTPETVRKNETEAMQRCLERLPEKQKRMVALRYEQAASFEEIATGLRTTAVAVQRALSRLRKALYGCVRSRMALDAGSRP